MNQLIPRQPKRKRQPTAECMREQLRLAADRIIELEAELANLVAAFRAPFEAQRRLDDSMRITLGEIPPAKRPWWRRIFKRAA